jgi:DNA-binding YbaB/EbfC family protein
MFKNLGNLAAMLKQAQQFKGRLGELQEDLKKKRVVGHSGADLVEVEADGLGQIVRVTLDAGLVERRDRELLEDLIPSAVNQALAKAKQLHSDALRELSGGLDMPQLEEMIGKLDQG